MASADLEPGLAQGLPAEALIPADLAGLARAAELLRTHAVVLEDAGRALARVEVTGWQGSASTACGGAVAQEPTRWFAASAGLEAGAEALEAFAAAIPPARVLADEARDLYSRYRASAAARATPVAVLQRALATPPYGVVADGPPGPAPGDVEAELRDRALATLQSARDAVRAAAGLAARAIAAAAAAAPQARRFYEATIRPAGVEGAAHLTLDGLGMLPVVGAVADLGNAAWYASEDDYLDAGLSVGSAVPGVGDVAGAGVIAGRVALRSLDRASGLLDAVPAVTLGRVGLPLLRAGRDLPGRLLTHVPYGFASREAFAAFGERLQRGLAEAGYVDAKGYLCGSATSGVRYRTGESVATSGPGDLDVAIVSPQLLDLLRTSTKLRSGGTRSAPLGADRQLVKDLGLDRLLTGLSREQGRDVSIMVYGSEASILRRGDAVLLQ